MKLGLALALAAITTPAGAQRQPVTEANAVLAATSTVLILVDRGMTVWALRHGMGEYNPIIGPSPSVTRLNIYIAAVGAGNLAIGFALHDNKARNFWWEAVSLMELAAITHQVGLGIPVRL